MLSTAEPGFIEYGVSVDNGTPRSASSDVSLVFLENGLAHGRHVVEVTGNLPAACGERPREEVTVMGDDTVAVEIDIECGRTTGDVMVSAITTGTDIDANGYLVLIGQQPRGIVNPNSSTTIQFLQPGFQQISLADVAPNCTTSAAQSAQITAGGTASVIFNVICAPVAVLRFVATTTGADRDPDGSVIQVDNGPPQRIPPGGAATVRVSVGSRAYAITDVQPNCTLGGPSSGSHTLAQGDTVTINVDATCSAIGYGAVGVTGTDAAGDTLSNPTGNQTPAFDALGITGRYTSGFMIVVVRFNRSVAAAIHAAGNSIYGFIDFDADENAGTGVPPASNSFGGSATMGSDYMIPIFLTDTASTEIVQTAGFAVIGRVRTHFAGDSMTLFMPLNKFNNDQNMAMTLIIGTADRPTDLMPNVGTFLLRPPASVIAGATVRLRPEPVVRGQTVRPEEIGKWKKLTR
jgi:hypothetical protein